MNYEIQYKNPPNRAWIYWGSNIYLRKARRHIKLLRNSHNRKKFRLVSVTRKVVKG